MSGEKTLTIKLTREQQKQVKDVTGKSIEEVQLTEEELAQASGGTRQDPYKQFRF